MRGVLRRVATGGATVVRGSADPLPVVVEGRAEPRPKLGQGGPIRAGEGQLIVRNGGRGGVKHSIGRAGLYGGLDSSSVEGLEGGFELVQREGTV